MTVNAKDIDGYKADKDKDSVKITEGKNEIVFVYTKQHNVKFETDGHGTLDGTTSYTVDDKEGESYKSWEDYEGNDTAAGNAECCNSISTKDRLQQK